MTTVDDDKWEPTPDELEKATVIWAEFENRFTAVESLEYDGVNGLPPDWIPESSIWRFRQTRNYFLEDCGYTPALLEQRIDYYCENGIPPFHMHPNQKPVDKAALNLLLGFLANLRWVVSLGQSKGLTELANIDAANTALGKDRREQLSTWGEEHGTKLHEERAEEWRKWRKETTKLIEKNPCLARRGFKSELARKIKKNLNLTVSIRTIRNRI